MTITTDHPASSYGVPVIVGDDGDVLGYPDGVKAVRRALGLSTAALGGAIGASGRSVEDWEQGRRTPSARYLYEMARLLMGT